MKPMETEPTIGDVLREIKSQKADTDRRLDKTNAQIDDVLEAINTFAGHTEKRFDGIEKRLTKVETTMVTKDYLDEKLGVLRGDFNLKLRTNM